MRKQGLAGALQKFNSSSDRIPKLLDHCKTPEEMGKNIQVGKDVGAFTIYKLKTFE